MTNYNFCYLQICVTPITHVWWDCWRGGVLGRKLKCYESSCKGFVIFSLLFRKFLICTMLNLFEHLLSEADFACTKLYSQKDAGYQLEASCTMHTIWRSRACLHWFVSSSCWDVELPIGDEFKMLTSDSWVVWWVVRLEANESKRAHITHQYPITHHASRTSDIGTCFVHGRVPAACKLANLFTHQLACTCCIPQY